MPTMITRVVVLHGFTANPGSHWYPWLQDEFAGSEIAVDVPRLPSTADPQEWYDAASRAIGQPDAGTAVVGHSVGSTVALHVLGDRTDDWRLGALILNSAYDRPLPHAPAMDGFVARLPAYASLRQRVTHRRLLVGDVDPIVPRAEALRVAASLAAEIVDVPGAGHFLERDGYTEHRPLAELLRRIAQDRSSITR